MRFKALFALIFINSTLVSGSNFMPDYNLMSAADEKWVDSVMSVSSFSERIAQLVWLPEESGIDISAGGVVFNSPRITGGQAADPLAFNIVNLWEGFTEEGYYPFPGGLSRKAGGAIPESSFLSEFRIDFWADLEMDEANVFYGIDLIGRRAVFTGYQKEEEFIESLLNHQFVLIQNGFKNPNQVFDDKNYDRKTRKIINRKVKETLAFRQIINEENRFIATGNLFNRHNYEKWKYDTYVNSLTLTGPGSITPIKNLFELNICYFNISSNPLPVLEEQLNHYTQVAIYQASDSLAVDLNRIDAYEVVIMPIINWSESIYSFIDLVKNKNKLIIVNFDPSLTLPAKLRELNVIHIWEHNPITEIVVPQSIFGAYPINGQWPDTNENTPTISRTALGRLQFANPEMAGMEKDVLDEIDNIIEEAITEQAMPGCQILIARKGKVVFHRNYGYQTYDSLKPITDNSIYDLASLTKVMSTTQLIMTLEERGLIELDSALSTYLPELKGTNKQDITIREIMAHQAGLFPYLPFWARAKNKPYRENLFAEFHPDMAQIGLELYLDQALQDTVLSWAIESELIEKESPELPYEYKYSDIGFYLLKTMGERMINQPIDDFVAHNLFGPLGMRTCFEPLCYYSKDVIVPTEVDDVFRKELVHGFVHDRNAALFGGVSGHAGLFGNAHDIAKLLQMHLQKGFYGGVQYYYPETIELFTGSQFVGNRRGLGWDKPSPEPNGPTSDLASELTFGHTGFTGTGIWADPKEELIFIFLSNRVHPSSDNLKLIEQNIRTRVQDLAYGAIITEQ